MKSAPLCKNCGKPLPKIIEMKSVRTHEQAARGIGGRDWLTADLYTPEDVKRVTNAAKITKITYNCGNSGPNVSSFSTWDGESYRRDFCTIRCAAEFGHYAVSRGIRRPI